MAVLTGSDLIWFYLVSWIIVLVIGFFFRKTVIRALAGVYGWFVGFNFGDTNEYITLFFFALNLYVIFEALDNWEQ